MEQFNLDTWLQDKSRKVVTRRGNLVRIICTDRKHGEDELPIVFLEECHNGEFLLACRKDGRSDTHDTQYDLFFADNELTEFENKLVEIIKGYCHINENGEYTQSCLKDDSKELLDLARKELEKENSEFKPKFTYNEKDYSKLANKLIEFRNNTPLCSVSYRDGEGRKVILHYEKEILDLVRNEIEKENPYNGKQKQEWSKEDSERLARIHQFIWANRKGDTDEIYQQEQDADWLMSIIPQSNQYDKGYEDGYSAAKYNQWKPTDKQMEDFRMLLDYNIGVFDYVKFMSANSLYDDLKKNLID